MRFLELKCKNCGANLNLDMDNLQAFCQFCGCKLLVDVGEMSNILKEKEITKQVLEMQQQETKRKEMQYIYKEQKGKREFKEFLIIELLCFGIPILLCICYGLYYSLKEYLCYIFIGIAIGLFIVKFLIKKLKK